MKKVIAILSAIVLVLAMGTTAFAAEFTPSVVEKDAPTIVGKTEGTSTVVATIVNKNNAEVEKVEAGKLIITPVSKADTSTEIPAESKANLKKAYEELSKADIKLSDLINELDEDVKEAIGKDATVDHLVIRDMFDASLVDAQGELREIDADHRLIVKFNIGIAKDVPVFAMKYNEEGKWESVYAIHNNGDGTVTCEFDHLCPIAFMVAEADSADTGDNSVSLYVWIAIAAAAAAAIVVLFVLKKKANTVA